MYLEIFKTWHNKILNNTVWNLYWPALSNRLELKLELFQGLFQPGQPYELSHGLIEIQQEMTENKSARDLPRLQLTFFPSCCISSLNSSK